MFRIYRDLFRLIIAKDEEKLKAKEAKARAKALKAQAKAEKKRLKAEAKARAKTAQAPPPIVVIPLAEKKPWWKRFIQEHLVQIIIKVIAGLIVAYLVWRFGFKK